MADIVGLTKSDGVAGILPFTNALGAVVHNAVRVAASGGGAASGGDAAASGGAAAGGGADDDELLDRRDGGDGDMDGLKRATRDPLGRSLLQSSLYVWRGGVGSEHAGLRGAADAIKVIKDRFGHNVPTSTMYKWLAKEGLKIKEGQGLKSAPTSSAIWRSTSKT